jgi:hypothetical protein
LREHSERLVAIAHGASFAAQRTDRWKHSGWVASFADVDLHASHGNKFRANTRSA